MSASAVNTVAIATMPTSDGVSRCAMKIVVISAITCTEVWDIAFQPRPCLTWERSPVGHKGSDTPSPPLRAEGRVGEPDLREPADRGRRDRLVHADPLDRLRTRMARERVVKPAERDDRADGGARNLQLTRCSPNPFEEERRP